MFLFYPVFSRLRVILRKSHKFGTPSLLVPTFTYLACIDWALNTPNPLIDDCTSVLDPTKNHFSPKSVELCTVQCMIKEAQAGCAPLFN